jgi:hypothetical protein
MIPSKEKLKEVIYANYLDGQKGGMLTAPADILVDTIAEIVYEYLLDQSAVQCGDNKKDLA